MSKSFWLSCGGFVLCQIATLVLAHHIEKKRWEASVQNINQAAKAIEENRQKMQEAITVLHQIGEETKAKKLEKINGDQLEKRQRALEILDGDPQPQPSLWENIPGWLTIFAGERKTALTGLTLLALLITFAILIIVTSVRDQFRRFESKIGPVSNQAELNRQASLLQLGQESIERERNALKTKQKNLDAQNQQLTEQELQLREQLEAIAAEQELWAEVQEQAWRREIATQVLLEKAQRLSSQAPSEKLKANPAEETAPVRHPVEDWSFSVQCRKNGTITELPSDKEGFTSTLQEALINENYPGLDPRIVYGKMQFVCLLDKQQRFKLKEVSHDPELKGLKSLPVGSENRIFLEISEEYQEITILPRQRKDAYSK